MKTVIYYATPNPDEIRRIRREYGLPDGMNVNGETECNLPAETLERLKEEIRRGTVQVRRKPDIKPPRRKRKETQTPYPGKAQACRRKANQHV